MPSKTVDALMDAVGKLHDSVIILKKDMEWIKRGVLGIYATFGAIIVAAIGVYIAK